MRGSRSSRREPPTVVGSEGNGEARRSRSEVSAWEPYAGEPQSRTGDSYMPWRHAAQLGLLNAKRTGRLSSLCAAKVLLAHSAIRRRVKVLRSASTGSAARIVGRTFSRAPHELRGSFRDRGRDVAMVCVVLGAALYRRRNRIRENGSPSISRSIASAGQKRRIH